MRDPSAPPTHPEEKQEKWNSRTNETLRPNSEHTHTPKGVVCVRSRDLTANTPNRTHIWGNVRDVRMEQMGWLRCINSENSDEQDSETRHRAAVAARPIR